jgi:hypothetical protein
VRRFDVRDWHIYGGLAMVAVFGGLAFGWLAPALVGAALFYVGVWRLG